MDQIAFKKTARRITIELIVIVFASIGARVPAGVSFGRAWTYVWTYPLLAVHIGVGVLVVVETIVLLVRSVRARQGLWVALATIGTVFLLLAFAGGTWFMADQQANALDLMSYAWFAGIVTYGLGWYLGRRRQTVAAPS